jgi:hypothetical protein
MSEQIPMPGEFIYAQVAHVAQIMEYGVAFGELVSGTATPPPEGARFDAVVEGTATGPKLTGVNSWTTSTYVPTAGSRSTTTQRSRRRTRRSRSKRTAFSRSSRDRRSLGCGTTWR